MAENTQRTCPQDCMKCGFQQHAYCAAQMALSAFKVYDDMNAKIDALMAEVKELKSQSELASPIVEKEKPKHRTVGGADNRPTETLIE